MTQAANGTSRLSTVPPGESPTTAPLPPPESWEAAMIQESRRHSRRRYGALGLDGVNPNPNLPLLKAKPSRGSQVGN